MLPSLIWSSSVSCDVVFWPLQDVAADAFVPAVSVISTSPDLRWTVQPAVNTSVSRQKTKSHGATQTAAAHKAKPSNRKGHKEKVYRKTRKNKKSENSSSRNIGSTRRFSSFKNTFLEFSQNMCIFIPCLKKIDKAAK